MTWLIAPLFAPRSNGASPKPRRSLPGIFYLGKSRTHLKIDFSTVFVIPTKLVPRADRGQALTKLVLMKMGSGEWESSK